MKACSVGCWLLAAGCWIFGSASAGAEPLRLSLAFAPLTNASLVLSGGAFDAGRTNAPIVRYAAFGDEVILPSRQLLFPAGRGGVNRRLGAGSMQVRFQDGAFTLLGGGQPQALSAAGIGLAPVAVGADVVLAFPRAYTYKGEGHLFVRSGGVRVGVVDGVEVRLYDDDLDGRYTRGSDGVGIADRGIASIFAPLGERLPTPAGVYTIRDLAADGAALTLERFDGPAGKLTLAPVPNVECRLALAAVDGTCAFGTLAGGTPLCVPAGSYRLLYGNVYRPATRRVVGLVLPSAGLAVTVGKDQEVTVTLGDRFRRDTSWSDGTVTLTFRELLAIDLAAVVEGYDAGRFAEAQQRLEAILARFPPGPNREASAAELSGLQQDLALESGAEGTALRQAEAQALAALRAGQADAAKAALDEARKQLAAVEGRFAGSWALRGHQARVETLGKAVAGTMKCGLGLQTSDGRTRNPPETADTIDWYDPAGRGWGHTRTYTGMLLAPVAGSYELALESVGTAKVWVDGQVALDHPYHLPAERSVRLDLTAGPHALKVDVQCYVYGYTHYNKPHMVKLRWTPPGQRRAIIPAWALAQAAEGR